MVGALSMHQKVAGSIPSWGTYLGCRFKPHLGCVQEATSQCFSVSPPLPKISILR